LNTSSKVCEAGSSRFRPKKIKAATKDGVVEITIPLPAVSMKEPVTITPTVT
jgi:HSP20 family molecular chaperone IbpA